MNERAMSSREEQKYQTRRTLMRAALTLMTEGSGFGELSLRGVTREAGLAPTAFYRHFENMEELGLSLVDETFVTLRRMLRDVWRHTDGYRHVIRSSVAVYVEYLQSNVDVFSFVVRERHGGTAVLRAAIQRELRYFAMELAAAIGPEPRIAHLSDQDRETAAHLIVSTVANFTGDLVDAYLEGDKDLNAHAVRAVDELTIITLGIRIWNQDEL